jgi:hypothetical protein
MVSEGLVWVRDEGLVTGIGASPGERRLGRPFWTMRFEREHSRWPPLRLAQLCREHVSVCVEEVEVRAIGLDVHRDFMRGRGG